MTAPQVAAILTGVLLVAVAGCRTKGPEFDPYFSDLQRRSQAGYQDPLFLSIQRTNQPAATAPLPSSEYYTLGPGDVVGIEMLGETDRPVDLTVGPDGRIYYSLLSGVSVWGLTLAQTKSLLEEQLAQFILVKPELSVTLKGVASKRVWILGAVQAPGIYIMPAPMNLLEVLSLAGGTLPGPGPAQEGADLKNSFVMRDGQVLQIDFHRLFKQGDLTQNIYLQPGDYIYLRPAVARDVYVLGMVLQPNVVPYSRSLSLIAAIAAAGGPIEYAYLSHIAVVRGSIAEPAIAILDYRKIIRGQQPNIHLEPGDIVYVPKAPYARLQSFAEGVLREFVRTVALNEGNNAVSEDATPVSVSIGGTP